MLAFVVHRWYHVRCDVAAYNIPAFALVSTCVRTLLPLVPYHGLLMSLFPYRHPFVCCLSWCRCTPYAKKDVRGWGALFPIPILLRRNVFCCVVLCGVVSPLVVFCLAVLHCVVWCCVPLLCVVLCRGVSCCVVWCWVVLCCVVMCLAVSCCVV